MKIPQEIVEQSKKDIQFAKNKLNDTVWWHNACDMSKEMVTRNSEMTPLQLAEEHWAYIQYRGNAMDKCWGTDIYIDKPAREKYLRLIETIK